MTKHPNRYTQPDTGDLCRVITADKRLGDTIWDCTLIAGQLAYLRERNTKNATQPFPRDCLARVDEKGNPR